MNDEIRIPLRVSRYAADQIAIADADGLCIAVKDGEIAVEDTGRFRRIVVCVNACAGVPFAVLEGAAKNGGMISKVSALAARGLVNAQRDQLAARVAELEAERGRLQAERDRLAAENEELRMTIDAMENSRQCEHEWMTNTGGTYCCMCGLVATVPPDQAG